MVFNNTTAIINGDPNITPFLFFLIPFCMVIFIFTTIYCICKYFNYCILLIVKFCFMCYEPENKNKIDNICIIIFKSPVEKIVAFEEMIVNN